MTRDAITRSSPKKLNLGCGRFPRKDCIKVDILPSLNPDVVHNLDEFPYPFADGQFDCIYASHVLEHLNDPFAAVREWHRLLSPGGLLHIKVPHFSRGFTHPDHKRGFDVSFPLFYNPAMDPWYTGTHLCLQRMRLRWNGQPYLKSHIVSRPVGQFVSVVGAAVDALANLWPMAFSRLFTFWVGGFEEIEFVFRRPSARELSEKPS